MQNMTQRDVLNTKNYILAIKKLIFKIEIFSSKIEVKKIFEIEKYKWLKMQNMSQRGVLITKNYILAH